MTPIAPKWGQSWSPTEWIVKRNSTIITDNNLSWVPPNAGMYNQIEINPNIWHLFSACFALSLRTCFFQFSVSPFSVSYMHLTYSLTYLALQVITGDDEVLKEQIRLFVSCFLLQLRNIYPTVEAVVYLAFPKFRPQLWCICLAVVKS